jgi:U3 small nucleolar RNA-associated protein MPP10
VSVAHTGSLEDMIKKRIQEERFDTVVPTRKDPLKKKKGDDNFELSQEKSNEGLGDIYEKAREGFTPTYVICCCCWRLFF